MSRSASNLKWCDECHCWHRIPHLECPYHPGYQQVPARDKDIEWIKARVPDEDRIPQM